jgi:opacity protein-like surface antigen
MPAIRIAGTLCFGLCLAALSSRTYAAEPLGLYVGAAAGQATTRADQLQFVNAIGMPQEAANSISENATGWKIMLGVRPISSIGAELDYIDFGHPSTVAQTSVTGQNYPADLRVTAPSAFGVFYAPIPAPAFDLYGKIGVSSVRSTVNATEGVVAISCARSLICTAIPVYLHRDRTDTRLAYGAGVQVKLARFAVRAEYERISASTGDPSLMSLGLIWRFD